MPKKSPIRHGDNRRRRRALKIIRFGHGFAGMDATATALDRIFAKNPQGFTYCFASDILKQARDLLQNRKTNTPNKIFDDVTLRKKKKKRKIPISIRLLRHANLTLQLTLMAKDVMIQEVNWCLRA